MIEAKSAYHVTAGGTSRYAKAPDVPRVPASVVKLMTLYVAREVVTDAMLDQSVTFTTDDAAGGSSAGLQVGDVLTWDAIFHGLILPSGNDAAQCIGRVVGEMLPGSGPGRERFIARMNTAAAELGWQEANFANTSGLGTVNRLTARQACELALALDPYAVSVAGALTYSAQIAGPNARAVTWTHTIDPSGAVPFPEFIAGKTGTLGGQQVANAVFLWEDSAGETNATTILESWPQAQRFVDMRAVIDIAAWPLTEGGLQVPFTIDGVLDAGQIVADNRGNTTAAAVLEIHGPAQFPQVRHAQSRAVLSFDTILDHGQWLEVDLDARTVLLNGQASRRGVMRGQWFDLAPGLNTVGFESPLYNPDARLVLRWRDAYR